MGITLNPNILFRLSGITPLVNGAYIFEQNPSSYNVMAPKQMTNMLEILEGNNIYQRALLDNEVRVMQWQECSYALYTGLRNFSARTISGTIPTVYFWDGTVREFQGAAIEVIDVYGQPIKGKTTWTVQLQFKPVANFDKEYKVL